MKVVIRGFLLGPSLAVTALVLAVAVSVTLARDRLTELATRFYGSTDHVLYPFLAARVAGYRSFLWVLLGILAAWCLVLWVDPRRRQIATPVSRRMTVALPWTVVFLVASIIAVLLSHREWVRFGRPCWDNYCVYSQLISSWLRRPSSETWAALHAFMRTDYHANSPFVPVLVAGATLVSGMSIIHSYRALCAAATVLALVVLFLFLRRRLSLSAGNAAATILLLASNIVVIRCCCFPQTDAFIFLWVTLSITRSLVFLERPTQRGAVGCFAILTTGLFIKLSFLPALALIPLWTVLEPAFLKRGFSREAAGTLARRVALFVVGPLVVYLVFQVALGLLGMYGREFSRMQTDDAVPLFHLISLVHAGAILLPLIVIGARRLTPSDRCLLAWTGLYCLSLWAGRTSGWDRFYLATLPPLAIVSRHGIQVIRERLSPTTGSIGAALYAVANYCALLFNLYQ